ncbi:MAG TPA: glycosyltransferase family 4 protein [Pseudonocardia sp.]|nr:glycosyltransferase family 4 protein [Pseudonocardia sp.]
MRILHVIDNFGYGGAEILLATLNGVAAPAGLEMGVACLGPRTPERSVTLPLLTAAGLEPRFIGVRRLLDPTALGRIRRTIRESGCDVVHAHLGYAGILVPPAARLAGVPCVTTLHHEPPPTQPLPDRIKEWLWTRSAERGAALVWVSEAARTAAAAAIRPTRDTWRVLHNGVDLRRFSPTGPRPLPADLLATGEIPDGAPVVTVVAALRAPKGHEVALRAWPAVRAKVPDAVLLIVGHGPHEPALRAAAGEGVVFAGSRTDVPAILAGSTMALLPSLTEALPTTLIEAAASGLAVVATTVGGTAETVEHGRTGLLVPPGDPDELAAAVTELLLDPDRRTAYGAAGRRLAEDRFDLDGWVRNLAGLYADAVAGGTRTARGTPGPAS